METLISWLIGLRQQQGDFVGMTRNFSLGVLPCNWCLLQRIE